MLCGIIRWAVADRHQPADASPQLSVVVCTHDRPERLSALLSSLERQTLAAGAFEVIVVDDGSEPPALADGAATAANVRLIRNHVTSGPAAARNRGWRLARGALIGFTDDDCIADPRWLEAALAAAERNPGAIVQGRTEPVPDELDRLGVLSRTVRVERLGPHYETCNIFYPRALLEELGGFDEAYGTRPAAEDTDLAWRALERGYRAVFADGALVDHAVERLGATGMLRVATRWSEATRVLREHPQTRVMLYRGLFWNVWHYLMWRSVLSSLAPAWLRRLLITRHLLELRKRARVEGGGPWAVPFYLVHDAVECWAIARGAIRYRTWVL
jgi:GT2 family glycosyltransferase